MAITLHKSTPINAVRVISERDDAIDTEKSDYQAYRDKVDESKLTFVTGKAPTIFLCNFKLGVKEAKMIKNAMMGGTDDSGRPQTAYGSWSLTVAKVCLKDIQNPDYVPSEAQLVFKKDGSGYVHDDVLAQLEECGVVGDIFSFYVALTQKGLSGDAAKN